MILINKKAEKTDYIWSYDFVWWFVKKIKKLNSKLYSYLKFIATKDIEQRQQQIDVH